MSSFEESVEELFPGALPSEEFLDQVEASVGPMGFTPERTLSLVSVCRDELTSRFTTRIDQRWGTAFTLAGLGGVPALGRTGWQAALAHIPAKTGERGCVLVFGFPHIGIEVDGTVGFTQRRGQDHPTSTCGALSQIFTDAQSGNLPLHVDVDDYEATTLSLRLVDPRMPPATL